MNAVTPVIRDSEVFGAAMMSRDALEFVERHFGAAGGPVRSEREGRALRDWRRPDRPPGDGIPVFHGPAFTGRPIAPIVRFP